MPKDGRENTIKYFCHFSVTLDQKPFLIVNRADTVIAFFSAIQVCIKLSRVTFCRLDKTPLEFEKVSAAVIYLFVARAPSTQPAIGRSGHRVISHLRRKLRRQTVLTYESFKRNFRQFTILKIIRTRRNVHEVFFTCITINFFKV